MNRKSRFLAIGGEGGVASGLTSFLRLRCTAADGSVTACCIT
jgi:hypothetical protein